MKKNLLASFVLFIGGGVLFKLFSMQMGMPGYDAKNFIFWGVIYVATWNLMRVGLRNKSKRIIFAANALTGYAAMIVSIAGISLIPYAVMFFWIFIPGSVMIDQVTCFVRGGRC